METLDDHLCGLLQPCCLEKISKAVIIEVAFYVFTVSICFLIISILEDLLIKVYLHFYCPKDIDNPKDSLNTPNPSNLNNVKLLHKPVESKTSNLFKKSEAIPEYNFNF